MKQLFELENRSGIDEGTLMVSIIDVLKQSSAKKFIVENCGLQETTGTYTIKNLSEFVRQFSYECWCARHERSRYAQSLTIWADNDGTLDVEIVWRRCRN